jgi:hypothetical protein
MQVMGEQLEWDLYYQILGTNPQYYPYTTQCKFKLATHISTQSSISYTLEWEMLEIHRPSQGPYLLDAWNQVELPANELRFPIKIKLGPTHIPQNRRTMNRLYNAETADAEIKCGGKVANVHKTIVAAHSGTLRLELANSTCHVKDRLAIAEEHIKPTVFDDVFKWMYLHHIENAEGKVEDLLEAAEYLQIAGLKETCSLILMADLNKENCLKMLNTAYKYNIKNLKQRCNEVFVANKKEILETTKNMTAVVSHVPALVVELLGLEQ